MPVEYTNRELGILLQDVKEMVSKSNESNSKEHDKIITRLDYTNGKVRNLRMWRAYLTGGIAVLAFMISLLASVVYAFAK